MLFFAHIGITLGTGLAVTETWRRVKHGRPTKSPLHSAPGARLSLDHGTASFTDRGVSQPSYKQGLLTLAACVIGSLLPDIIDKPLGHFLFPGIFGYNGRIMAHTLVFLLVVLSVGLYLYRRRLGSLVLILAYGDAVHLVLDSMWQTPQTLFWPLLGWSFPRSAEYAWLGTMWNELFHDPSVYSTELLGLGILLVCGLWLLPTRRSFRSG